MANVLRILLDGVDVRSARLERCRLSLRAGGPDELSWATAAASLDAAPSWDEGDIVVLALDLRTATGELVESETLFRGRVVSRMASDGALPGWDFRARDGWDDLRRVTMTQSWQSWNPVTESLSSVQVPRIVLGLDADGAIQTTGDTIAEILDHAASKGALVAPGTISVSLHVPPVEMLDEMCDAALRQQLAYHPDAVAWIAGGETLHVRFPEDLPVVAVDPCAHGLEIDHDPRADDIPGGVTICWERTHDLDGETKVERIHQSAGVTSGWPPPLYTTIPLAGVAEKTAKEPIETRTLPNAETPNSAYAKLFLKGLLPRLDPADPADLFIRDYSVEFADPRLDILDEEDEEGDTVLPNERPPVDHDGDEPGDFPRMLVSGEVRPWFPESVKQYDAILRCRVHYKGDHAGVRAYVGSGLEISEPIVITNALPKTYRTTDEITLAEEPVEGLAAAYWSAISRARNEGALSGAWTEPLRSLRPGARVTVAGRFSDPAVVSGLDLDCLERTFRVEFGGSEYLTPKSLAELAKAMSRRPPTWKRPEERTEASGDGSGRGELREGAKAAPAHATPHRPPRKLWDLELVSADTASVRVIFPGQVRKTTALDASGLVAVSGIGGTFTASAGKLLVLRYLPSLATTLELIPVWDGWPMPIDTEETSGGLWVMAKGYFPLWEFVASSDDPDAIAITDTLHAERRAPDAHLIFGKSWTEDADGHVVPWYELLPAGGCRPA